MTKLTDPKLNEIRDAMDKATGGGRDLAAARTLADTYVLANSAAFAREREMSLEQLVQRVSDLRAAGNFTEQWKVETWLLHRYEPQNIGGTYQPQIRAGSLG